MTAASPARIQRKVTAKATANGGPAPAPEFPWSPPAEVDDLQGFCGLLFSHPGAGKTTLLTSMLNATDGGPLLIVNFDIEVRSLRDLAGPDVMVWPGKKQRGVIRDWNQIQTFLLRLLSGRHPFKSIGFDTLNGAYGFALEHIRKTTNPRDPRMMYGQANDLVIGMMREWSAQTRQSGINVVFTCHDQEKSQGEDRPPLVRPDVTPGVIKIAYQVTSCAAYLEVRSGDKRRLTMHNKLNTIAKLHQPRSGPQLDLEIDNPDLGRMIDHLRGVRTYPAVKKASATIAGRNS